MPPTNEEHAKHKKPLDLGLSPQQQTQKETGTRQKHETNTQLTAQHWLTPSSLYMHTNLSSLTLPLTCMHSAHTLPLSPKMLTRSKISGHPQSTATMHGLLTLQPKPPTLLFSHVAHVHRTGAVTHARGTGTVTYVHSIGTVTHVHRTGTRYAYHNLENCAP